MRCLQTTDGKQLEGGGQREKQRALPKSCLLKVLVRAKSFKGRQKKKQFFSYMYN